MLYSRVVMKEYNPDNWVIVKLGGPDPHYRVLAGWVGGYLQGDYWRINSGIVKVKEDERCYWFYGATGSVYRCCKPSEKLSLITNGIFSQMKKANPGLISIIPFKSISNLFLSQTEL